MVEHRTVNARVGGSTPPVRAREECAVEDNLCPYCDQELEITANETAWYGTLVYGVCEGCKMLFVRDYDGEWVEAAENGEFDFCDGWDVDECCD